MKYSRAILGTFLLFVLAARSAFADDEQRRRAAEDRRGERAERQAPRTEGPREARRAVPRASATARDADRQAQRQYNVQQRPRYESRPQYDRRDYAVRRSVPVGRSYGRPYFYSDRGSYRSRARVIRPAIVTVVPYRPYVYRPRLGIGLFYGSGGAYPYGYTPRGYYDPIPGRAYGGLRITDAPRDAQVFADGYYVGIVDDFDGLFQHVNLEAGPHRIEIEGPGFPPIAFDVLVQPGRTTTFRADEYRY